MIVAKFGGSILDGADGLQRLRREVETIDAPLLVVVSAFAKTTQRLERAARMAVDDLDGAVRSLAEIWGEHDVIARALFDEQSYDAWSSEMEPQRARLTDILEGLSIVGELSPRTLDLVEHFGERLSSSLVARALGAAHLPATELIVTDDAHRFARVIDEPTKERVVRLVTPLLTSAPRAVVVTEGYIARGSDGEITTMGRESSDYSAAILGAALGAREVRIYTGVPGIMTADPALVPSATTIPAMSYEMARTVGVLGAKVIHPRTIRPLEITGIPLILTDLDGHRTIIGDAPTAQRNREGRTFALTHLVGIRYIRCRLARTDTPVDRIVEAAEEFGPVIHVERSGRTLSMLLSAKGEGIVEGLRRASDAVVDLEATRAGLISFVVEGAMSTHDIVDFLRGLGDLAPRNLWANTQNESHVAAISALVIEEIDAPLLERVHTACRHT